MINFYFMNWKMVEIFTVQYLKVANDCNIKSKACNFYNYLCTYIVSGLINILNYVLILFAIL